MQAYASEIECHMQNFYRSLSEKDRRRYAALEAEKLGHGGISYIAKLFQCKPDTIAVGWSDIERLADDQAAGRIRKKGRPKES